MVFEVGGQAFVQWQLNPKTEHRRMEMAQRGGRRRWLFFVVSCFILMNANVAAISTADPVATEEFSEELLLRPLPDGNVLSHFHFASRLPPVESYGTHHRLFPKAIFQLVRKYRIREMELSFTQGRWNYQRWGAVDPIAQVGAKPVGVELSASFDVPEDQVDFTWGNLTHALSGLFCASINFLESPMTFLDPWFSFRPEANWTGMAEQKIGGKPVKHVVKGKRSRKSGTRYGALPREAVCTENLTPWLKLLPCRDKAGLTTLLDRPKVYSGVYHSLRLLIRSGDFDENLEPGTALDQTLTIVLRDNVQLSEHVRSNIRGWSLSAIFGSKLVGSCPLARLSNIYLELEEGLVKQLIHLSLDESNSGKELETREEKTSANLPALNAVEDFEGMDINFANNAGFMLKSGPDRVFIGLRRGEPKAQSASAMLEYQVAKHSELDVGMQWKMPVMWSPARGQFHVSRFLTGTGNARGSIAILFRASRAYSACNYEGSGTVIEGSTKDKEIDVMILQMVPWYVRVYGHTLQLAVDGRRLELWDAVRLMRFTPAEDRKSPAAIEIALHLPADTQTVALTIEYDKGFLHIDEHPPDANRGFDLPSAVISFPKCRVGRQYNASAEAISPFLNTLEKDFPMQMYSEVLLMQLATPDFSMPYNVITLTCTVLALYFGSLLNVLRRRTSEEQPQSKADKQKNTWLKEKIFKRFGWAPTEKHSKLLKIILVVIIGIAVNHYLSS